ncbi:hypothetical protein ACHAWC_002044, partial [Mediolabrus comicus]
QQHIINDFKQHAVAISVAILAALITHAHIHGGFTSWKEEMRRDWDVLMRKGKSTVAVNNNEVPAASPFAAPSINSIPTYERKVALDKAMEAYYQQHNDERHGDNSNEQRRSYGGGGHERARAYRRTAGLSFCPTAYITTISSSSAETDSTSSYSSSNNNNNLEEMEFLLPLEPSVRVLHSYYLADAFGVQSSLVYDDPAAQFLGTYGSDIILKEIDDSLSLSDHDDGPTTDDIRTVLESHLPPVLVNTEHICLLHQYAINKHTGRSIRGTTMVYKRPHVSTFYRNKLPTHSVNNMIATSKPESKVSAAPLTHTGFATKFINLSLHPVNLYWDGGRIPSGPRQGQMYTTLVGTVESMESIGTASHPGHQFYVTATYDKDSVLHRQTVTADEPVWYYDPLLADLSSEGRLEEMERMTKSNKWTTKQRFGREAWMTNESFSRDYLVKSRMMWLANFPQPYHDETDTEAHHIWPAEFFGQVHQVDTAHLYFNDMPPTLEKLTKQDYHPDMENQRQTMMEQFQSSSVKGGVGSSSSSNAGDKSMTLNVKVVSCTPRVFEVKRFLSPTEVQHLINLASGTTGNVRMEQSTVSANPLSRTKRVRGDTKADVRSSMGGWIHREQDVIVDTIFRRVADLLKIDEQLMRDHDPTDALGGDELPQTHHRVVEAMQLLRYDPGTGYAAHHDFTFPSIESRYQPRRFASVLLYLTGEGDVVEDGVRSQSTEINSDKALEGGETTFPRAVTTEFHDGIKIKPQSGKAVLFYNVLPDGNMDDLSQHAGEDVKKGVKYLANIFVWDPVID